MPDSFEEMLNALPRSTWQPKEINTAGLVVRERTTQVDDAPPVVYSSGALVRVTAMAQAFRRAK
jgi:hypothetical protein